jgi:hypothetical protein
MIKINHSSSEILYLGMDCLRLRKHVFINKRAN